MIAFPWLATLTSGLGWSALGAIVRLVAAISVVAALAYGLQCIYQAGFDAAETKAKARELAALESERLASDAKLKAQLEHYRRLDHETHRALGQARERAASSRADAERLRQHLVQLARSDPAPTDRDSAAGCARLRAERDRLAELLAEGASLVAEAQQRGDELAIRLKALGSAAHAAH